MARNKRDKTIRRWFLVINGERFRFTTKKMAAFIHKSDVGLKHGLKLENKESKLKK